MNSKLKKCFSVILNILVCFIIVVATIFVIGSISAKQNGNVPSVLGYSPVVVLTGSMQGTNKDSFNVGDLVVIGKVDATKLKENDVISFWDFINGKKELNTHRIIKIEKDGSNIRFTTKGDHNPEADLGTKSPSDVVGKYQFKISNAGQVANFLGSKWGFLFCLVLPLFLFFIWRLVKLVMAVVEYKKVKLDESSDKVDAGVIPEQPAVDESTTAQEIDATVVTQEITEEVEEPATEEVAAEDDSDKTDSNQQ